MVNKMLLGVSCILLTLTCGSCSRGTMSIWQDVPGTVTTYHAAEVCIQMNGQTTWSCS